MKKFVQFALVFMLAFSVGVNAQTVLLEANFDDGLMPAGWSTSGNPGSSGFSVGSSADAAGPYFTPPEHGNVAYTNDDACNCDKSNDQLLTSEFTVVENTLLTFSVLFLNNDAYGDEMATVTATNDGGTTWFSILNIENGDANWQDITVSLNDLAGETIQLAFNYDDGGGWSWLCVLDDIKVYVPADIDVAIGTIQIDKFLVPGYYPVTATITNVGANTIESFYAISTIDGETGFEEFSGLSIAPLSSYTFTLAEELLINADGLVDITLIADAPNGEADANPGDNTALEQVLGMTRTPQKVALVEEFTGAWCQFCPDGAYNLDLAVAQDNVVGMAIHNGDAMVPPQEVELVDAYVGGFPSGMVDRFLFPDLSEVVAPRNSWAARSLERTSVVAPAALSVVNSYNPDTRVLNVTVNAEFLAASQEEYRISVAIVEDHVTGTGTGYNQVNFYNTEAGHPYAGAGNPIIGFDHRHVLRDMLGGAWGQVNSVTVPVALNDVFTQEFTYTLDADWDDTEVSLIALLHKYSDDVNDREIINALDCTLNNQCAHQITEHPLVDVGIENAGINNQDIRVYPNPTEGVFTLDFGFEGSKNISVAVYNPLGQVVISDATTVAGQYSNTIDLTDKAKGIYMIAINVDGEQTMKSVVVQ